MTISSAIYYILNEDLPISGSGSGSIAFSFPFRVGVGIGISPLGPASFALIESLHDGPNEARFIKLGNLPDDFGTIVSHFHKGDIPLTSISCLLYSCSSSAACLLSSASSFFMRLLGANPSFFPLLFGVKYRLAVDNRTRAGRVRRLVCRLRSILVEWSGSIPNSGSVWNLYIPSYV